MSARSHASGSRLALAAGVLVILVASACGSGEAPSPPGSSGSPRLTVVVNPPQADGRRDAKVTIESDVVLSRGQLEFAVPDGCSIVAGAAFRQVAEVVPGKPTHQELAFRCDGGVEGEMSTSFTARDPSGSEVKRSVATRL